MKHNYSNADIRRATVYAGLDIHAADIRLILEALPEPATDDWQECRWVDYRPGDRMMQESDRATIVYKSPIRAVHEDFVQLNDKNVHHFQTDITYYRIPAPVQHPDPAEHPVILIPRYNGVDKEPHWTPAAWNGQYYKTINAPEYFSNNEITNWKPGKVVEDDR